MRKHAVALFLLAAAAAVPPAWSRTATPGLAHPQLWPQAHSHGLLDAATEARITQLLGQMSLEEKVGQMIQADIASIRPEDLREVPLGSILAGGNSPALGADGPRSPAPAWVATARAFRAVALEPRAGHEPIPLLFGLDAVHGNSRVVGATLFPHNIGLGAAHDPVLMRRIGEATAEETAATGIDWAFGPALSVPRDLRWGRHYEGYAEEPALVREYADAMVRGLQGEPGARPVLQSGHVAASAKHFIADGGTRDGIDQGDADISEAGLIRIHAPGYPVAIDAGVMTVMASFSSWQGVKMHANRSLLTGVLKGRFGFEGFVVSDWNAHGQVPGCSNESCAAAFNAGIDMLMAPDSWKGLYHNTLEQARAGTIPPQRINDAVRRILRVKFALGLFDPQRPWEGREGVVGSPQHRALARQAVRESLVLLKNNGAVLPIRAGAHVLVAGSGADDIGRQCGGWTLSWQGTGNHNSDFPNGQSIYAGLREALEAGGGGAELSADGSYAGKPDVAVVVIGETPYAEGWGDLKTLEYQPGDKSDLALLKRLRAQGVPVVTVFLSGRPLWVNPEINASDAFVAAWLPGSEGGGIADVLIGDAAGRPRFDFSGKLSFSWPRNAAQAVLNRETRPYRPQFPYGYGLSYRDQRGLPALPEDSGVAPEAFNFSSYLVQGRAAAPWQLVLRGGGQSLTVAAGSNSGAVAGLTMRAVDAEGVQEAGRELSWSGQGEAAIGITGGPLDMRMLANGDAALNIAYRVDERPTAPVRLELGCGPGCGSAVDLAPTLNGVALGEWHTLKVKLACLRDAGADVARVMEPFALSTAGSLRLSLSSVQLASDPAGAVCPPAVH
ncbi:MAG TPA: exo 1,3/1,4-beta-D-glucan glucohydrolase [Nevskia sp.]|nr:exo 1,3/1,4-beta-D-glucan glucohydrolase [Nevskia sp.]